MLAEAQAKLERAKREAEALLISSDASRKAAEFQGELFSKFPMLYEIEMAKIKAQALKNTTIYITPQDMGNFFSSPLSVFTAMSTNTLQKEGNGN